MQKAKWHFITAALAAIVLCALASCSGDGADADVPSAGDMTLSIGFKVPTRAADDGYYEEGDEDENYIDVAGGKYRIYFFDTDSLFIAGFDPEGYITSENSNYTQYSVLGEAPEELVGYSSFKMVVLANWPTFPDDSELEVGKTTIGDICNAATAQYSCLTDGDKDNPTSVALDPDANRLMPFYGVHEYKDVTFKANQATILDEPVTLLRAMAKVEVILETDDYYDLSFDTVKVNRYNAKGYCAPAGIFHQDDYDHNGDYAEDYVHTLHLVGDKNDTAEKSLSFRKVNRWDEGSVRYEKWVAYLPEYQNKDVGSAYSSIKAKFNIQLSDDDPHTIYFTEYKDDGTPDSGNRLNIERNNIYRFHVKCTGYNYTLLLTVSDWEGLYENKFEYGNGQFLTPDSPWEDEINNDAEF